MCVNGFTAHVQRVTLVGMPKPSVPRYRRSNWSSCNAALKRRGEPIHAHVQQDLFDQGLVITRFDLASCHDDFGRML